MADSRSVLVCEDDPVQLALLSAALGQAGYDTLTARSPGEALEKVKAKAADVVVADVHLTGGNAFDVLGELRRAGYRAPMLMLSGHADGRMRGRAIEEGASGLLEKPVNLRALVRTVRSMVQRPQAALTASLKVLLVEPDAPLRRRMAAAVEGAGMRVEVAPSVPAAVQLVRAARVPFDFAVVALAAGGAGAVERLLDADPGLYLVTNGAPNGEAARAGYRAGADTMLQDSANLPRVLAGSIAAAARKRASAERRRQRTSEPWTARWARRIRGWIRPGRGAAGRSFRLQARILAASLLAGALVTALLGWGLRETERAERELQRALREAELRLPKVDAGAAPWTGSPPSRFERLSRD
jgi:DNA-binding response OmpR family regulator